MARAHTRDEILDVALQLVQTAGYHAFSFGDLSDRVGIKTASIHYHFPKKADLGRELLVRHRAVVARFLAEVDEQGRDPRERLKLYCNVFRNTLANGGRMCLGGMLAIEFNTLPHEVVAEVRGFYGDNERWLSKTLTEGREAGKLSFSGQPDQVGRSLFDALEGAILAARAVDDFSRLDFAIEWHLRQLSP